MANKPVYYWDACLFYEWLGEQATTPPARKAKIKELTDENERGENVITTSVITHLEVLPEKLTEKDVSDGEDYLSLFDGEKFHEIELNQNIVRRAREIRDHYYRPQGDEIGFRMMDLGDAIHLATATINEVDEFHTRDNDSSKSKVPLLSLYENFGETKLCGKYELKIISPESDSPGLFDEED